MVDYIEYNREERNICGHLFHLLLSDYPEYKPLKDFIKATSIEKPRIFIEVALLRDAYFVRKPNSGQLLDLVTSAIGKQEGISNFRLYSELPEILNDPMRTHPKQIRYKADSHSIDLSKEEKRIYGSMQGMFNAKPDMVICHKSDLIIYEAKLTMSFDNEQLERTKKNAEIWAQLLYKDLGFTDVPKIKIVTIGLKKFEPDISWNDIYYLAKKYLNKEDFSLQSLKSALNF